MLHAVQNGQKEKEKKSKNKQKTTMKKKEKKGEKEWEKERDDIWGNQVILTSWFGSMETNKQSHKLPF